MKLQVTWANRQEVLAYLLGFAGARAVEPLMEAVGRAAIRVQDVIRNNLEAMVYSQPMSPSGYQRTRTLFRSAHAAKPSTEHSGDEAAAFAGANLAATDPMTVVERRGDQIVSEVGSWVSYSEFVHEGVKQPSRPFVAAALPDAERIMEEEIEAAVLRMAARPR